jgi:hypothetical protein
MIEWRLLQIPLVVLLVCVLISGTIWSWANAYNETQMGGRSKLERDYTQIRQRYNEARRDRALYKEYLESFLNYRDNGIIGDEQRLSWIEELEVINRRLKLATLRYEINPQSAAEISGLRLPSGLKLNSSKMKLTAGALHEGDVLYLLSELRKNARGYFSAKSCELTSRLNQQGELRYQPNASYVNMVCELEWYSIEVQS